MAFRHIVVAGGGVLDGGGRVLNRVRQDGLRAGRSPINALVRQIGGPDGNLPGVHSGGVAKLLRGSAQLFCIERRRSSHDVSDSVHINWGAAAPLTPIVLHPLVMCSPPTRATRVTDRKHPGKDVTINPMKAILHTTAGDITVELFPNHAPNTVNNFVTLAKGEREWVDPKTGQKTSRPLYDGTIFHRVIPGFMIQGGDPLGTGTGGPGYQFNDEIHPELTFNDPYLLAMANAGKRMGKGTNGSQFFITVAPTPWLLGNHTIFGRVVDEDSKRVVDAIATTPTGANDRPVTDQVINSIEIVD